MLNVRRGLDNLKNIILIAPPGAGKGTISNYLVEHYGYVHVATGDLLRCEIAMNSELGQEIDQIISKGYLAPDDIVIKLVLKKLEQIHNKPFILDGFPRTLKQAEVLQEIFLQFHLNNITSVYLDVDVDTVLKRIEGRRICNQCQKVYNIYSEELKPIHEGLCDNCGGVLVKRSDDEKEKMKIRFQVFKENVESILNFYQSRNELQVIPATTSITDIVDKIINEAEV